MKCKDAGSGSLGLQRTRDCKGVLGNIMICCPCVSLHLLATVGQRILDKTDL